MHRPTLAWTMATLGLLAAGPEPATAQVSLDVRLVWHAGDDGVWRAHGYRPAPRGGYYAVPVPARRAPRPARHLALRIPPGHLPPPGYCRLWYPGRPPGHQPPPAPCGQLLRSWHPPGAVLVGSPLHEGVPGRGHEGGWRDRDDDRGYEGRGRKGRGNGKRGNGRGRGG